MKPRVVTDDERRDVARRLRKNAEAHPDMSLILNLAFADDSLKPEGAMEWKVTPHDAAMRLADLIDRPTCRVVKHDTFYGSYGCEEAGTLWTLSCGDECINDSDFPPRYCPECGAEVVSDGD